MTAREREKALIRIREEVSKNYDCRKSDFDFADFKVIETALIRLEELENTNIVLTNSLDHERKIRIGNEKKLKALEIIKKKNVDIGYFREDFVKNNYGFDLYEEYPTNYHFGTDEPCYEYKGEFLTKEEFYLLKEVLL